MSMNKLVSLLCLIGIIFTNTAMAQNESNSELEVSQTDTTERSEAYYLVFPNQYYVSVGANYLLPSDDRASKDPIEPSMNLMFGMELAPSWGLEFNYLTKAKFDFHNIELSYNQWELTGRYTHELSSRWGVYSRFGLAKWDLDKHYPADPHFSDSRSSDGFSFIGELGGSYALSPKLGVDFGYAIVPKLGKGSTGELTMHRLNVSLNWKFGFNEKTFFIKEKSR
ncbi:porin family protein [Vibrio agarivorans]|uniref:porin family protein n=1 Tax=Vibrio agarivorans TaxID=153622 RepID=UPI0022302845|nr:porin family protein [Vibrio agarivorans]